MMTPPCCCCAAAHSQPSSLRARNYYDYTSCKTSTKRKITSADRNNAASERPVHPLPTPHPNSQPSLPPCLPPSLPPPVAAEAEGLACCDATPPAGRYSSLRASYTKTTSKIHQRQTIFFCTFSAFSFRKNAGGTPPSSHQRGYVRWYIISTRRH